MKAELLCLIDRFSAHKTGILALFDENEDFQTLCHEYFVCVQSLNQWKLSFERKDKLVQEFSERKTSLENKLFQFFQESDAG